MSDTTTAPAIPFAEELNALQQTKLNVIERVKPHLNPTSQTIARQCFDALDTAALFMQQLGIYLISRPQETEQAAEDAVKSGNMKFPAAPAPENG